ncbi:hypothetical protein AL492_17750 [Elizabethkingia anophelis]|uniref:DUF6046 domain-containing protein n=1 Tax=Elizabethkingia anophelis TaxID=1117645 RepID=UPI000CE9563F|nr:DUF6046 domain-containing protein [Elizabethkingia anophelis]AVF49368.1 hypothetical protein AL491_15345 [Elizabethkingia anophelis]AVF53363.1 hypothetical protein AL492_17750 [Elizabethkingia anophelis]ELB0067310.1 hypothetical protein [Elizabethkingia anophelis]ELB1892004.1 hypothetical protein [Elizabethkingia anophelis]MDV2458046.1 hypothetical protein [Elizabethkingia anophelis]
MTNGESIVINLAARYAAAFGIIAISNKINQVVAIKEDNKYQVEVYEDFDDTFEEVYLEYNNKELKFSGMLEGDTSSVYAPPLMMNFTREKNLIETNVSGGDSVVIERWGTKPWNIDIRGILIDTEAHNYPSEKIKELCRLFDYNDIISVVGRQFYEKDIKSIYLKSVDVTPVEGFADTIQFTLKASSINPVTYTLLKPNE